MNPAGATPAIQSQWTNRPNSGLIVALRMMDTPTTTAAHISENVQLRSITVFASALLVLDFWFAILIPRFVLGHVPEY